mmetsp:Transcript_10389/g.30542  ORF Transcript_10389/g.30542 Transcript_10389/m.30542 type:complete len:223 (+) Transcript_10389:894-1562(+)
MLRFLLLPLRLLNFFLFFLIHALVLIFSVVFEGFRVQVLLLLVRRLLGVGVRRFAGRRVHAERGPAVHLSLPISFHVQAHALDLYVLDLHGALFFQPIEERPRINAARDAVDLDEERRHLELLRVFERDRADRERQLRPAVVDADPADVEVVRAARLTFHHVAGAERRQRSQYIIKHQIRDEQRRADVVPQHGVNKREETHAVLWSYLWTRCGGVRAWRRAV